MKLTVLAVAILGLAPAAAKAEEGPSRPTYTVLSRGGGLGFVDNEVTVISRLPPVKGETSPIWIAERYRNNREMGRTVVDHLWIDGRACPTLVGALEGLETLPLKASPILAFDVPLTILHGPARPSRPDRKIISRTEFIGPVATWRFNFEKNVDTCWREQPPVVAGAPIRALLSTQQDADEWAQRTPTGKLPSG